MTIRYQIVFTQKRAGGSEIDSIWNPIGENPIRPQVGGGGRTRDSQVPDIFYERQALSKLHFR